MARETASTDFRLALARLVDIGKVRRDGFDIRIRQCREAAMHDRGHRARRCSVQDTRANAQIVVEFVLRPRCGCGISIGQRRRDPAIDQRACVSVVLLLRAEKIPWRVAGAAMAQTLRQISAAIPFGAFSRHRAGTGLA